jgi:hypothetical protein
MTEQMNNAKKQGFRKGRKAVLNGKQIILTSNPYWFFPSKNSGKRDYLAIDANNTRVPISQLTKL